MPRHTVVPAVLFLLEKDGRFLFQLRHNTGVFDNLWSMPGGHVEPGEHILQAVVREAHEELGITVKEENIHLLGMHHVLRQDGLEGLNLYYKIAAWEGEAVNADPAHSAEIQWFSARFFPENINPEFFDVIGPKMAHLNLEGTFQPRLGSTPN